MKIALIGYGKMGKTIERIALERGHKIVSIIDVNNDRDMDGDAFKSADVAIEFTTPATAYNNYLKCFEHNIPVVSGTTGWLDQLDDIKRRCEEGANTFFYASNFSIGVNIFFELNKHLARIMNKFPAYGISLTEAHHAQKLDKPSGTAITLAEDIIESIDWLEGWTLDKEGELTDIPIYTIREGDIPGIHEICYESEVDYIQIKHSAKSRDGFALGAVMAAEFTQDKKGFLGMNDMLNLNV